MSARLRQGWLEVPYDGSDLSLVYIGTSAEVAEPPEEWKPAFLDYDDKTKRVAKIIPAKVPQKRTAVWIKVDGASRKVGNIG